MRKRKAIANRPRAFACGLMKDGARALFLIQVGRDGKERLLLPFAKIMLRQDPVSELGRAFMEQAGIDAHVGEIVFEGRYNAGSRKYREWIPLIVFEVRAKRMQARPSPAFAGFRWLSLRDAIEKDAGREIFLERWARALLRETLAPRGDAGPGRGKGGRRK